MAIFFTTSLSAQEAQNCSDIKKTSPKYLLCKAKSAGGSLKNKFSKKDKANDKPSFFQKFKNAKTLSDLRN